MSPAPRPAGSHASAERREALEAGLLTYGALSPRQGGSRTALAVSVLLHTAAVVVLLSIQASEEAPPLATPRHITLIAPELSPRLSPPPPRRRMVRRAPPPAPQPAPQPPPQPMVEPTPLRSLPRQFRAPVQRVTAAEPLAAAAPRLAAPIELKIEAAPMPSPQLPVLIAGPPIHVGVLDGTASPAPVASAVRPHVGARASGFGSGPAPEAPPAATAKSSRTGAFGDAQATAPAARSAPKSAAGPITGVEILSKPRPVYTAEARRLGIEGEVLLEVLFRASGESEVLRLVRSLGHGLDESAADAARQIRFKPARREGVAVDATAIVHISFELAF